MKLLENVEVLHAVSSQTVTNTSATSATIDLVEATGGLAVMNMGTLPAGSLVSMNLHESDAAASGFALATNQTVTVADTDDNKVAAIQFDPKRLKRYLRVVLTNGAAQNAILSAVVLLQKKTAPVTAPSLVTNTHVL